MLDGYNIYIIIIITIIILYCTTLIMYLRRVQVAWNVGTNLSGLTHSYTIL